MSAETERSTLYAAACMMVLVFAAFLGAYAGMGTQEQSTSPGPDQLSVQHRLSEGVMPNHTDTNTTKTSLGESDNIQILLHEYDTLREEIIQRWVGMQQQISIGVIVLLGIITVLFSNQIQHPRDYILYSLLAIAVCVFIYAMWQVGRDSGKAAERVREIEREVNLRAGAELLQWETHWGGGAAGYWGSSRPVK
jgi:Na+/H+ antiporter NhaC